MLGRNENQSGMRVFSIDSDAASGAHAKMTAASKWASAGGDGRIMKARRG